MAVSGDGQDSALPSSRSPIITVFITCHSQAHFSLCVFEYCLCNVVAIFLFLFRFSSASALFLTVYILYLQNCKIFSNLNIFAVMRIIQGGIIPY